MASVFVLKMRSRVLKLEFLLVRQQIINKVLETVSDFCPNITTVESIINPQEVIRHPLKSVADLTLCRVSDIALAISLSEEDVKHEYGSLTLSQLLQFEPYAGLDQDTLQYIHSEKNNKKNDRISNGFISRFVDQILDSDMYMTIFNATKPSGVRASQSSSPKQELVQALKTWRDKTEGTYSCLRETLNKYSIFTERNPLVRIACAEEVECRILSHTLLI